MKDGVLIETLWNVNLHNNTRLQVVIKGINRNIVECKYVKPSSFRISRIRINRNIVECKSGQISKTQRKQ